MRDEASVIFERLEVLCRQAGQASDSNDIWLPEIEKRLRQLSDAVKHTTTRLADAQTSAATICEHTSGRLNDVIAEISQALDVVSKELESKSEQTSKALQMIRAVGRQTHLLGINASVEAAHAREHGAGFAIVAAEVRQLARESVAGADEAANHLQLLDVLENLHRFRDRTVAMLQGLSTEVAGFLEDQRDMFQRIGIDMQDVTVHKEVIREAMAQTARATSLASEQSNWASAVAADAANATRADARLGPLLAREHLTTDRSFDLLEDIRTRKVLRVAVDPTAIGLVSRIRPGEPLFGLDIDYATAFAQHLGVRAVFIEHDWSLCTHLLLGGRTRGEPPADVMWHGLPPHADYLGVAYSEAYTYLNFALVKRAIDTRIRRLSDIEGKVLGCVNDPAAFATLEAAGVRWTANRQLAGGTVEVANLMTYTGGNRFHDALVDGSIDAFAGDLPMFWWAATDSASPWYRKIEVLPGNLASQPWYYAVAVAAKASSYTLLCELNRFIAWFWEQPARTALERRWQGEVIHGTGSYRDEPGNLMGEAELRTLYEARQLGS